jgi:hypothetical protein
MKDCAICFGIGWVCENHPKRAWEQLGCECGAGIPCKCKSGEEPDVTEVIIEEKDLGAALALLCAT